MCPYCIHTKERLYSISCAATVGYDRLGNLKPGCKVSYDHYVSREPGFIANNHENFLKREIASCSTILVDHSSYFTFRFVQTSTKGVQTVEAKHKLERLANNCGVEITHCHADDKIFNKTIFR